MMKLNVTYQALLQSGFLTMWGPAPENKPYFLNIKINGLCFMTSAYLKICIYKKPLCIACTEINLVMLTATCSIAIA